MADLSNWYLDVIKDRLYVSAADSFDRRASQTMLHALLQVCDTCSASRVAPGHSLCRKDPLHYFIMACRPESTELRQVEAGKSVLNILVIKCTQRLLWILQKKLSSTGDFSRSHSSDVQGPQGMLPALAPMCPFGQRTPGTLLHGTF